MLPTCGFSLTLPEIALSSKRESASCARAKMHSPWVASFAVMGEGPHQSCITAYSAGRSWKETALGSLVWQLWEAFCSADFLDCHRADGLSGLSSSEHPGDHRSCCEGDGKCGRNSEHRVSLDALSCVIQEFFRGIAAPLRGAPHYSHAVLNC